MNKLLLKKNANYDYSQDVLNVVHTLEFNKNKINIVGSMSYKSTLYPNDYDCYEQITVKAGLDTRFKHIIKSLQAMKNTYIGDMKFGEFDDEPIRWKPDEILQGYKQLNPNTKIKLLDAIKQHKMNKIDVISLVNNSVFKEFSCVYMTNMKSNFESSVLTDIVENYKDKNYFKTCKRLFSYYKNSPSHSNVVHDLQGLFNSNTGLLYNVYSDVGTILYLFENFHNIKFDRIVNEIDNFKNRMSNVYKINKFLQKQKKISTIINSAEKEGHTVASLIQLQKILDEIIQQSTLKYMKNHGIIAILKKIM